MSKRAIVCPSILSADFGNVRQEVEGIAQNCQMLHLDIMDGHFVPNLTMGPAMVKMLRSSFDMPFDIHLMIDNPEDYLEKFADAGGSVEGSILTVHQEVCPHLHRTLEKIHRLDKPYLAGCALNPGTPSSVLDAVFDQLDVVLIMTVDPGFGGQGMIESCLDKIGQVREMSRRHAHPVLIELDGGVKTSNLSKTNGADLLVMGSAIFSSKDPAEAGQNLIKAQRMLDEDRGFTA